MNELNTLIAVFTGIAVRLVIPMLVTAVAVYFLRKLDAHWQSEGQKLPEKLQKPACWEVMGCTPARRKDCPGYTSALPCWQALRTRNGYMREECLGCKIFLMAPAARLA